jgi:hypothetical protein
LVQALYALPKLPRLGQRLDHLPVHPVHGGPLLTAAQDRQLPIAVRGNLNLAVLVLVLWLRELPAQGRPGGLSPCFAAAFAAGFGAAFAGAFAGALPAGCRRFAAAIALRVSRRLGTLAGVWFVVICLLLLHRPVPPLLHTSLMASDQDFTPDLDLLAVGLTTLLSGR